MKSLEENINKDFEDYYSKKNAKHKLNIFIIDMSILLTFIIGAIIVHFILKKSYNERLLIFKSLTVIEEEEVYRIQKSVS